MSSVDRIRIHSKKDADNARAVADAMTAISRATNTVPITRIEWLVVAFIATQTVGSLALLGVAFALLRISTAILQVHT